MNKPSEVRSGRALLLIAIILAASLSPVVLLRPLDTALESAGEKEPPADPVADSRAEHRPWEAEGLSGRKANPECESC